MKIYIIIFVLLALSVGAYFFFRPKKEEEESLKAGSVTKVEGVTLLEPTDLQRVTQQMLIEN